MVNQNLVQPVTELFDFDTLGDSIHRSEIDDVSVLLDGTALLGVLDRHGRRQAPEAVGD